MNYEFLLNREDRRSYLLLKHLEECIDLTDTPWRAQEELGMSSFVLKKTLNQLMLDLERFDLTDSFQLSEDNNEMNLEITGDYSSKVLLAAYLSESLSLKMLLSFFKEEFHSMEDFSYDNHVSYSVAYSTLQGLKKELNTYQIFFDKGDFIGNQRNVALFLSSLFSFVHLPHEESYSKEVMNVTNAILAVLEKNFSLSGYEKSQLFHYLAVFGKRDTYLDVASYDESGAIFTPECLLRFQQLFSDQSQTFVSNIIYWLYIHEKLDESFVCLESSETIMHLNQHFIDELSNQFIQVSEEVREDLYFRLAKIHFNISYHPMSLFEDYEINILFFKQNYTEFYYFLLNEVNQITKSYAKLEKGKVFLFFHYLMLLINHVPLHVINDPIKILIDFSYGTEYNQFIKKNLTFYVNLNILFVDSDWELQPDVVITNVNGLYSNKNISTTVWLDPPRTVDWVILTNNLLEIKEEKYQKNKREQMLR
ncbi:helix-turn-helix domain-containing protein [Enterococcus sp. LJL98]